MLGTIQVERSDIKLTPVEVKYWKRIFKQNLKIGVEIESYINNALNDSATIIEMAQLFTPTNSVGKFGNYGVCEVKFDGSVQHGFELCTVGRRPNFLDLYYQYESITSLVISKYQAFVNSRCGLHNHVLLDYYNNDYTSLEQPVPGIIMRNFIQLTRRYLPALVYITSSVNNGHSEITRYDTYCSADTLIKYTPMSRKVHQYFDVLREGGHNERYKFLNCIPMKYNDNDEITRFHFEFRFPDGSLYPAQIATQNMIYAAMLLKAIELSELGIISTGGTEEWNETKELYSMIRNDEGYGERASSLPSPDKLARIKEKTLEMLIELKPQLDQYDNHIYGMAYMLANKPVSLLRRENIDEQINDMFRSVIENMYNVNLTDCDKIVEIINLQQIMNCSTQSEYENKLAKQLETSTNDVQKKLFKLNNNKPMEFDIVLGAMKFK